MRRCVQLVIILSIGLVSSVPVFAQDKFATVEARIRVLAPTARSIEVSETQIEGILQVQVNGDIVYATDDGKYMIQGRIIDLDTRDDLTEISKATIRKELLDQVDSSQQITFAGDETDYDLMVFTDIDCGYCRKLHAQIEDYNDQGIAIHYMAFPRAGIGSASYDKAVSVWCASDQQSALTNAKSGAEPDPQQCENPVAEQYQLGVELGVTGTPALLTVNGQLIPGYVPPEALRERLDQMQGISAASE